jgi:glycosyltransferase involved in cell wall biosynthesis
VDLVIPVYNEAHVLAGSVRRLLDAMANSLDFDWRIVIVDNGSVDGTAELGRRLAGELQRVEFLHLNEKGRGRALRKVWMETSATYSIYMDVDLSTDLDAIGGTVTLLRQGADIVTGSRLDPRSRITRSRKREILSRVYNKLISWILRTRAFDDAQCGFKGIRVATVRPLLPLVRNQNWFFDTELLVLAEYAGLTIRTLAITWIEDADSRVNIPRTIWEDLKGLARLRMSAKAVLRRWKSA